MPEEKEEKTKKTEDTQKWDEARQKIDQAEAVALKAQKAAEQAKEEAESYAGELDGYKTKVEQLEKTLAQQQKSVDDEKDRLEAMDEVMVDKSVRNNFAKIQAQLDQTRESLKEAQGKITQYETVEKVRAKEREKQKTIEKVLTPLDEEFGAKYRNPAWKLANQLVDDGEVETPKDALESMILMRKCYKQVIEDESKKTSDTPADGGGGGVSPPEKKKQGTMQEILAEMRRDKSWKA